MGSRGRLALGLVVCAMALVYGPARAVATTGELHEASPGPPFDSWGVELTADPRNPQVLELEFDSKLLRQRVTSLVYVPDHHAETEEPLPVVYYLHGSSAPSFLGRNQPGARTQVEAYLPVADRLDPRQRFLVVAPDVDREQLWCAICTWIDGRGGWLDADAESGVPDSAYGPLKSGRPVLAESHLHEELIPLIQALFRVRSDRGGRGVVGQSMGGAGALIQGFRHPDRFRFVGSISGPADNYYNSARGNVWAAYFQSQGYNPTRDEVLVRNFNQVELARQLLGAGVEIVMTVGDGCIENAGQGSCAGEPPDPLEAAIRANDDAASARFTELGLPHIYIRHEGVHGGDTDSFQRYFLERANSAFERPVRAPRVFSYKTVDRRFSIWDYRLGVERPNNEFLHLVAARRDGRRFTLAGTGTVRVTTPPAFGPGSLYRVRATPAGGTRSESFVRTDRGGRLSFTVGLGDPRTLDQREDLEARGLFPFPRTNVRIVRARPAARRGPSP